MANSSSPERIAKALATLAVILGEDVSDQRLEAYLAVLSDLDGGAVENAIAKLSKTARFFPKPAEIRELIEDSANERAERAWVLLVEAAHKSGDRSAFFADMVLAQAMLDTFGTWIVAYESLIRLSPEMMASKRKEFVAAYRRGEKHPPSTDVRFQPGRLEMNNRESLPTWAQRWISQGGTEFPMEVLTVRDKIATTMLSYDTQTGNLSGVSRRALLSGKEPKQLPGKVKVPELPPVSDEARAMTPEEIKASIKQLTGRSNPL